MEEQLPMIFNQQQLKACFKSLNAKNQPFPTGSTSKLTNCFARYINAYSTVAQEAAKSSQDLGKNTLAA